jgi:hypothetical protein
VLSHDIDFYAHFICLVALRPWLQDDVAGCFDYYAELAEKLDARQYSAIDVGMEEFSVKVRREPLGVVGLITPWNYPLLMATVRPLYVVTCFVTFASPMRRACNAQKVQQQRCAASSSRPGTTAAHGHGTHGLLLRFDSRGGQAPDL